MALRPLSLIVDAQPCAAGVFPQCLPRPMALPRWSEVGARALREARGRTPPQSPLRGAKDPAPHLPEHRSIVPVPTSKLPGESIG